MAHLQWAKGGEARLVKLEEDRIEVLSTISSAPGSRLDGALPSGHGLRMKVHRCKKLDQGFAIEGRTIDLRREARVEVLALLEASAQE